MPLGILRKINTEVAHHILSLKESLLKLEKKNDFFVDCEGHIKDQKLRLAIKEIIDTGAIVRNFGSYPEYI